MTDLLGNKGTILRDENDNVRYLPQERSPRRRAWAKRPGKAPDIVGDGRLTSLHMQNFFDCVRSRKETDCPFDLGFRSAVACRMAVDSYRQGRTVSWDEEKEEIV